MWFEGRAGVTTWQTGPLLANPGDLVYVAVGGPSSFTLTAGAAIPNSHFAKIDVNANGYIGMEDEPNWPGGPVNPTMTLNSSTTPDGVACVFGPAPYTSPSFTRRQPIGA
jgi:hypothetical protein